MDELDVRKGNKKRVNLTDPDARALKVHKGSITGRQLQIRPHEAAVRRHRHWMETEEAKRAYRHRTPLIEPLFGILKAQMGAWRFALRGLREVKAEWTLLATAFNLRTLWRLWRARTPVHWASDPVSAA